MRRFWATTRNGAAREADSAPSVRFLYDRPLPYARNLRLDILDPDGSVVTSTIATYDPRDGWVTQTAANCA